MNKHLIAIEIIENKILILRGYKVMLDRDLANLYRVKTKELNKAVSRNLDRFPLDFMFKLTKKESDALRFQFGTSKTGRGGLRYLPYAFTEQGVSMLSSILKSKQAIQVNIQIMRTFTKLRQMISTHKKLAKKLIELERQIEGHDQHIHKLFEAIRQLTGSYKKGGKKIGFLLR